MNYEVVELEEKVVVGLTGRTGNNDPKCTEIIGGLWQKFMAEGTAENTKNVISPNPIGLYSNYDETSYDVTIGMTVSKNENPELSVKVIPAGRYAKFSIKGDVVKDVANAWNEIWKMPLERSYTADFEEYLSNVNGVAEIDIYVALK